MTLIDKARAGGPVCKGFGPGVGVVVEKNGSVFVPRIERTLVLLTEQVLVF